jgi:predicted HTH transcriptional regulator
MLRLAQPSLTRQVRNLEDEIGVNVLDRSKMCLLLWRNVSVIVIKVFSSGLKPHYLKAKGIPGGVYLRVGSTNRAAAPAQVRELQRSVLGETFDEMPMPELDSEAIDFRAASECFAPQRKIARSDLKTLHLIVRHQGKDTPSFDRGNLSRQI